jgi:peptidyl-prolyl cis-trans isomerase SurA
MAPSFLKTVFSIVLLAGVTQAADVIDRIVAVVNGHVVLQSQWDQSVSFEALLNRRPPRSFTLAQRKAALDRIIDQELIRQQSRPADFHPTTASEIDRAVADIREKYRDTPGDDAWKSLLAQYGLSEADLREKVADQIEQLRAVDAHLRPGVQVDSRSVETYYHDKLLPELGARGAKQVALADVAPEIREVLAQQKINDLLIGWLHTLRSNSTIKTPFTAPISGREAP